MASAATLRVEGEWSDLAIDAPTTALVEASLMRWESELTPGQTLWDFEGGTVTARHFWRNATVIREPDGPGTLQRFEFPWESAELAFEPRSVKFVAPNGQPELRFTGGYGSLVGGPLALEPPTETILDGGVSIGLAQAPAARFTGPLNRAGWATWEIQQIEAIADAAFFIDDAIVRLVGDSDAATVRTGESVRASGPTGAVVQHESYSFLLIELRNVHVTLAEGAQTLEGFLCMPRLVWDGVARLTMHEGLAFVDEQGVAVTDETLSLTGRFMARADFGDDPGKAPHVVLEGEGETTMVPQAGAIRSLASSWPLVWGAVALTLATLAIAYVVRRRPEKEPDASAAAAPMPTDIHGLSRRLRDKPLDAETQFHYGVALLRVGRVAGVNHLDRSFRLRPEGILHFLDAPDLAPIRDRDDVRNMLRRIHRDHQWRLWTGYV